MRFVHLTVLVGSLAIANVASAGCGCGGGVGAGGHGYGYGGYNCDFPSSLWQGFCEQPSSCCGCGGGCCLGGGILGRLCSPNYAAAGSGTWWYGYDASLCGCNCGCGGGGGCGLGCCGRYGHLGCFGNLFQCLSNKWAQSSWCGGGNLDSCGLVGGYGFDSGCGGGGCGAGGYGYAGTATTPTPASPVVSDAGTGCAAESNASPYAPSTIQPTPAMDYSNGTYSNGYSPQPYSNGQGNTFYESQPAGAGAGSGTRMPERLPTGTDDA